MSTSDDHLPVDGAPTARRDAIRMLGPSRGQPRDDFRPTDPTTESPTHRKSPSAIAGPDSHRIELGNDLVERHGQFAGSGPATRASIATMGMDSIQVQQAKGDLVARGGYGIHHRPEAAGRVGRGHGKRISSMGRALRT